MNHETIIKELDTHIDAIPHGRLGELLKACSRLIADQDETIVALTASETMRIEQLKKARKETAKLKRKK
jgi:hypothetical protein